MTISNQGERFCVNKDWQWTGMIGKVNLKESGETDATKCLNKTLQLKRNPLSRLRLLAVKYEKLPASFSSNILLSVQIFRNEEGCHF